MPAHRTSRGRQLSVLFMLLLACGPPSETTTGTTGTADTTSASGTSAAASSGTPPTGATGEGSTSETGLLPEGCGDGVPQVDVACYTRVVFPNIRGGARAPGDFNADCATDLALVDDDVVRIVLGDGKGVLTLAAEVPLGEPRLSDGTLHAADIDGDATSWSTPPTTQPRRSGSAVHAGDELRPDLLQRTGKAFMARAS